MSQGKKLYVMVTILLFLLIGNAFPVFAQSGLEMSVSGFVRDVDSNAPIPGIEVVIFKVENEVITDVYNGTSDTNGFYKVRYLAAGNYRFSVTMPTIGMIHIGMITSNGKTYSHLYELKIRDGQNIRLDIIMGENPYPSLKRKISLDGSTITFEMNFPKTKLLKKAMARNLLKDLEESCQGLTVTGPEIYPVSDDVDLVWEEDDPEDKKDVEFGTFRYILARYMPNANCENEKCIFYNFRVDVETCILIHSVNFFKEHFNTNDDEYAACLRECTKIHEFAHSDAFFPIACDLWKHLLNDLKILTCCGKNIETCLDGFDKRYEIFKLDLKGQMVLTEDDVTPTDHRLKKSGNTEI
jgi:hypothetical protein